jgi:hypothetical protein
VQTIKKNNIFNVDLLGKLANVWKFGSKTFPFGDDKEL